MARKSGLLVAAMLALGAFASPAGGAEATVSCAGLQSALSAAKAGDRITLDELCKSGFPYKLPAVQMTLAATPGAGFDGGNKVQLEGSASSPTIEGLIFENAHSTTVAAGGALSLSAAPSGSTVTLANDTFVNDVASGGEGGGAHINTGLARVTVTDSTFSGDSAILDGGGLLIFANTANLSGDTFTGNSVTGTTAFGGGLDASTIEGPITLSGSQFTGNSSDNEGGGAWLGTQGGGVGIRLSGNTFSHNSVSDPGAVSTNLRGYLGGGLVLEGEGVNPINAVQVGNTFDANSVSFKAAPASAMGGGEATTHIALQSTGDHFTNNTLQPPSEAKNSEARNVFGWGAGISVAECGDTGEEPPSVPNSVSTLTDAIVAGNTLQSAPSANGAGIYVGFACPLGYVTLQLNDSTVAGNVIAGASGPVAGISGGPHDVLTLANTIVSGDSGGPELGGFNSLASVTAAYSDACSGAAPFAGAGNICADPKLIGAGPGGADVHETFASPTLGVGSNALVPAGLTTDAYGGPRILGRLGCGSSPPAVVDIGAAELAYPAPPCAPPIFPAPTLSGVGESAKTWREGKLLAQLSAHRHTSHTKTKKPPIGTTFAFTLSAPAQVTFKFTRPASGRRVGRKCVAANRKNRRRRHCTRTLTAGTMTLTAHAGRNRVHFEGALSKHAKLRPGSYALLLTATASGKHSSTSTLHFKIVR